MGRLIVNPGGRVLELDDEKAIAEWLNKPGFRLADENEEKVWRKERADMFARLNGKVAPSADKARVFFKTLRSGANGYGMSRDHIKNALLEQGILLEENYEKQKIGFVYHHPYTLLQVENDIRVLFTMFESDKLPADWAEYLKMADLIIVPSKFCADVFERAGFKTVIVPLGYNDKVFKPIKREPKLNAATEPFTFIHYDSFNIRKGFSEVFQAFTEEFEDNEPVRLILKTVKEHLALPIPKSQYPQIEIVQGKYTEKELYDLLKRADCMVYPSRGEGFGITPLEAMATGMPAIVPNAHGITEYFNPEFMYEAEVEGMCPALYDRFKGQDVGKMVVCSVPQLRKQMRYIYSHQKEAFEKGRAAAKYVKQFTYTQTAEKLAPIFTELMAQEVVHRVDGDLLRVEAF